MAASSSSSKNVKEKYDVFISFRGEDTRDGFTSHLHTALGRKQIKTFIDNELKKGGEISPELEKAIEESKLSLVVFSKDYASSRWCLNELVKIIDCKKSHAQLVIPIFYHITPSEVRKQSGSFADAFSRHRRTERKDQVQNWEAALIDAAALAGWDSSVTRPESVLIDEIVKEVSEKLGYDSLPYVGGRVGIDSRVMQIKSLLNMDESSDVFCIGIWGMGGIGKTTVAEVVFNQISSQFEGSCFLHNVKDKSREHDGLFRLREKLLSKLLDENIFLETPRMQCPYIRSRLRRRKVLIVLDDINDPEQFEILVGGLDGFGPGSQIIVTSRDRQVLINCRVNKDKIYQVTELAQDEALDLFCWRAFENNRPPFDFLELSYAAVNYAKGNPLALIVLGSALQNKSSKYWKDTLNKLKRIPNPKIYNVLGISFDMLDEEQQNIFLDIVCFFNGYHRDLIFERLVSCYDSLYCGIEDLIDKSMITCSDDRLRSHDFLQKMGWKIVRDESLELGKRSRLWASEDVHHVLTENSGTERIEGIFLDMSKVGRIELDPTLFSRMRRLRLLKFFFPSGIQKEPKLHLPEQGLESLPNELRYLHWEGYPLRSLPSKFNPQKLVELSMPHSNLEHLSDGPMDLDKLKKIDLSYSKISSVIDLLPQVRFLTELNLSGTPIQEVPASIGCLRQLSRLSFFDCTALKVLPTAIRELDSLKGLFLSGCISLTKFPEIPENIRILHLNNIAIEEVPSSIDRLSKLFYLSMMNCRSLKSLPSSICKMKSLEWLFLNSCSNLESFPEILEKMESLRMLNLNGTAIKSIPSSVENLINLDRLHLGGTAIKELPPSIENVVGLRTLYLSDAINLAKLPSTFQLTSLEVVSLCNCPTLTKFLGNLEDSNTEALSFLSSVKILDLSKTNFEGLPNLGQLSRLENLKLCYCERLKSLPELPPSLRQLDGHGCTSLESVENFHLDWNGEYSLRLSNCFNLILDASDDIVANAYHNIQHMATAYVERFNHHQVSSEEASVIFFLPTSEIPAWFSDQRTGSSIVVELPPGWQYSQLLGVAFCVVVEFYVDVFWGPVNCTVQSSQGYSRTWRCWEWETVEPFADHLFLFYDHSILAKIVEGDEGDSSRQNSLIETSFELDSFDCYNEVEFAKVKKCGVRLVYKNNVGECPRNISTFKEDHRPSRGIDEEEENPQSRSFEEIGSSEMHRGPMIEYDANRGFNNGTESGAKFGSSNADDDDQESKGIMKEFNLWNLIFRFLHVCDVRNYL